MDNNSINVSVIIPTDKINHYLHFCIDSVLDNLPENSEVLIILNGNAARKSKEVAFLYRNVPVIRIETTYETGIVNALNRGIELARGNYIARMDHDDILINERLSVQMAYLNQYPKVGIVGTTAVQICSHGNQSKKWHVPTKLRKFPTKPIFPGIIHPTVMFRSSVLQKLEGYRHTFPNIEDQDLWLRALDITKVRNIKLVGLKYRVHTDQISTINKNVQLINSLRSYLFNQINGNGLVKTSIFDLNQCSKSREFINLINLNTSLSVFEKCKFRMLVNYWEFYLLNLSDSPQSITWKLKKIHFYLFYFFKNYKSVFHTVFSPKYFCQDCVETQTKMEKFQ